MAHLLETQATLPPKLTAVPLRRPVSSAQRQSAAAAIDRNHEPLRPAPTLKATMFRIPGGSLLARYRRYKEQKYEHQAAEAHRQYELAHAAQIEAVQQGMAVPFQEQYRRKAVIQAHLEDAYRTNMRLFQKQPKRPVNRQQSLLLRAPNALARKLSSVQRTYYAVKAARFTEELAKIEAELSMATSEWDFGKLERAAATNRRKAEKYARRIRHGRFH